ncbi:SPFH domain-containing protein [soil metagenome]
MFGFKFLKAEPTTYILEYRKGAVARQGGGLSFFYFAPSTSIVSVPMASQDLPFCFSEITLDFQQVQVQGQLTFRVSDPVKLSSLLNYSVNGHGVYLSDDPQKLKVRLINATQERARAVVRRLALQSAVMAGDEVQKEVLASLKGTEMLGLHGIEVLGLTISGITATPEMSKALEAEAREALQRNADEAIYDRRNAAVEQERRIKDSEMATDIMVEQKKRQIRETQADADIAIEEQRTKLLLEKTKNDREYADTRAYALEAALKPLRQTDWRTLMAANGGAGDSRSMIALAFRDIADNAGKIGELNISSELLQALLQKNN